MGWKGIALLFLLLAVSGCTERRQTNLIQTAEERTAAGRYVEASELLNKAVEINPVSKPAIKALYKEGFLLETYLHEYRSALKNYEQFIRLSRDAVSVYEVQKRIANIYFENQSDPEKAIAAYQKLISLNPDSLEADFFQFRLGQAYFQQNNFEQARAEYQQLIERFPKSSYIPHVRFEIGNTYYMEGKHEIAIEALKEVIRRHPQSEYALEAQFLMAESLESLEKGTAALQVYEGMRGRYPASDVLNLRIENLKKKLAKAGVK